MALDGGILGTLMVSQFSAQTMVGIMMPSLCYALSYGIVLSFLAMNTVETADVGVAVAGVGIGKMSGINPGALIPLMIAQFAGRGINGLYMPNLSIAISNAVCVHFLADNVATTASVGVSIGTGVGKVGSLIPTTMTAAIIAQMEIEGILGLMHPLFADAVANAVCIHILSMGIVNVVIVGAPTPIPPIPSVGLGIGKIT